MKKEVFILANANMNDASEVTHLVSALNELDKKINKITSSMNKMKLSQTTSLVEIISM